MKKNMKKKLFSIYTDILLVRNRLLDLVNSRSINILTVEDTVKRLNENELLSICRFGDGEFMLMYGRDIKFQEHSTKLGNELKSIIKLNNPSLLIGLPDTFEYNQNYTATTNEYWYRTMAHYKYKIIKLTSNDSVYGNALISRPYMNWNDKNGSGNRFKELFRIWEDKEILIVEGAGTKMGVDNDIFSRTKSVRRIITPSENAYEKIDRIMNSILNNYHGNLILVACGPTASIIVYRLSILNIRAIDLGHLDLEYEWYMKNTTDKIAIYGKYTSEVEGGEIVENITNTVYDNQIIDVVQ